MFYRGCGYNRFGTLNWELFPVTGAGDDFHLALDIPHPEISGLTLKSMIPGEVVKAMIHLHVYKQGDIAIQDVMTDLGPWKITDAPQGIVLKGPSELIGLNKNEVRGIMHWLMTARKDDEGIYFSEAQPMPSTCVH